MFRRILIANRGEIAVRVIRACREMGIEAVAVYSDADADAPYVALANHAIRIGPASPADSYLSIEAIVAAAQSSAAQAIHPGYGFLSENERLATACDAAGITFIGPPVSALTQMGSKISARRIAQDAGVPVVPGETPADQSDAAVAAAAMRVGLPVLIKPSEGGGGIGMKTVRDAAGLGAAITQARREAASAFGDGTLYVERLVERPRHVEFQVLADNHGHVVHLFERECSIQRRHQKIVEETPSPAVTPALRRRMGEAAVALARAADYRGAGTVEFLLDPSTTLGASPSTTLGASPSTTLGASPSTALGASPSTALGASASMNFYFLEMNTRLQVEHPITEQVTGVDIVRAQIAIAAGEPLRWTQDELSQRGHAIEVRVYAEDPARDDLPQAGPLLIYREPTGPGIRVDSGVCEGGTITVHYDPMIAKLIASAETREHARLRALTALRSFPILGVRTNVPFLIRLLEHPRFIAGDLDTRFLDVEGDALRAGLGAAATPDVLAVAAAVNTFAPSHLRTFAPSHPRTFAPSDPRTFAPSDPWATLRGVRV